MKEKHFRSIVKALSWRATGTLDTIMVAYFVTGTFKMALSIGFVELFTKVFLYYVHERVWNGISLGREKEPAKDYQI
jgi:uncharacterized membrane protein